MAEFKLGRIRFIWKGDWITATTYYKDDIVRYGGNTYICIKGHAAPADFTTSQSTYWNKISDGQDWKGNWVASTVYKVNDVVAYGGYLYIANTGHTAAATNTLGLEANQSDWDTFAEGFNYSNDWAINYRYKVNDLVKYGGTVYICITGHTSAATTADGLEVDQVKWQIFSEGFNWKSDWTTSFRYRVNDIVKYGGIVYVCVTGHTSNASAASGLEADQAKWQFSNKGIEYTGDWATATRYKVNDIVKHGGAIWICVTYHTSQTNLSDDEAKWNQFVEGLEFEDSWAGVTRYQPGDFVTYGGYSYVAKTNNLGARPTSSPNDWDLFTAGFRFIGDWGDDSSNYEYFTGDVVRLGGYTYLCITDSSGHRPPNATYWQKLNSGIAWKNAYANSTLYDAGDSVRQGTSSYICILAHTSNTGVNDPANDSGGTYWNQLAGGPETDVLTTAGDLVYYSGSGPARLPIGNAGQVLTVNASGNAPEWSYIGKINNIFYVDVSTGQNLPASNYGVTIARPWKSVRYACEQILAGALRENAGYLLKRNRNFIVEEAVQYAVNKTAGAAGIWSGFTFNGAAQTSFRADMGKLVDAIIHDVTHAGNKATRDDVLRYFTGSSLTTPVANTLGVAGVVDKNNETINYMLSSVIDRVLSNLAPAVNYQTTNSFSPAHSQVIDATYAEEDDAQTTANTLVGILTAALTAGVTTNIPAEKVANNSVFVKTGQFDEHLPIIVPRETAIIGDELRGTKIVAASAVTGASDVPKSIAAIQRLKAIISDIVINSSVTKTSGNASSQVTSKVAGSAGAGSAANGLFQQLEDYIDFRVNGATGDSTTPIATGTNTPTTDTGYLFAQECIEANRTFLKDEAVAYINATYPSYTYSESACKRDVDRYLDGVIYDLKYTGNYKTILNARYYANSVSGSAKEDMFYMRNGTGLRNCTISGLAGSLGSANAYGTKRPDAGAFVSLDPGHGVSDVDAHIVSKSPYVQNVSTFGTACIGMKVDGSLHDAGYDSIVANDFTQILSDGIGAWITNLGRAELVSVFTYYNHVGYLAENGGKIRATNGNNSYGDFGSVAEGQDATETAITGVVDNKSTEAQVTNVLTDGNNILTLEYVNAGVGYTAGGTTITITGEGYGHAINSPVVATTGGVYEVRLIDPASNLGGAGYVTAAGVAQSGNTTQIVISNTDTGINTTYVGMSIYITSGAGAGQYGYVNTYNSGSKTATIKKHSDGTDGWDHVTGVSPVAVLDDTSNYIIEPRVTFSGGGVTAYADIAKARVRVTDGKISEVRIWDSGTGYSSAPTFALTDPNNTVDVPHAVRYGDGVLRQPTWTNRGTSFTTAEATITGDGHADRYQPGANIRVTGLASSPQPGANVAFAGIAGKWFKLVRVTNLTGSGPFDATFQVSPDITVTEAPEHGEAVTVTIRYSQVRLTGHDYLDIGTGDFADTNYPGAPGVNPDQTKETNNFGGGRVFFTSTDQDGNFRVGDLFSIEQSTGIATLNADAFNISGLNQLELGAVELGGNGATITEFSTDGTFTADSDNIVPTQKAIKTYITSQIGGGQGELNVNSITAGVVQISGSTITTTTNVAINTLQKVNFTKGVDGHPLAMNYYLQQ
jgi:hypothetical protein